MVDAFTCGGTDASLLAQHLERSLDLEKYLHMTVRVRLDAILSTEKALQNLCNFTFVASHLFYTYGRHLSAATELLCLITRLEELHTEVQEKISPPQLDMPLIYNVSQRWSLYLNRCVDASASEAQEAPGTNTPFTMEPILLELKGGCYMGPILPGDLVDLLGGRRPGGSNGGGGGKVRGGGDGLGDGGDTAAQILKTDSRTWTRSVRRRKFHPPWSR